MTVDLGVGTVLRSSRHIIGHFGDKSFSNWLHCYWQSNNNWNTLNTKRLNLTQRNKVVINVCLVLSCISPVLKPLHWFKINEQIDYKLLSLTYKVLTTMQPSYLHNLISLQPPRCTRTSPVVTLAHPQASSSLKITNHSFRHASTHLWNKLPVSLRQPCLNQSSSPSSSSLSPLSSSITPSLFHSKLKTYLFQKSFSP